MGAYLEAARQPPSPFSEAPGEGHTATQDSHEGSNELKPSNLLPNCLFPSARAAPHPTPGYCGYPRYPLVTANDSVLSESLTLHSAVRCFRHHPPFTGKAICSRPKAEPGFKPRQSGSRIHESSLPLWWGGVGWGRGGSPVAIMCLAPRWAHQNSSVRTNWSNNCFVKEETY